MPLMLENGWPECDLSQCEYATIPGTGLRLPFQRGIPYIILQAFLRDLNEYIEPVMNVAGLQDEGSWTEDNSVWTSNHKGATAFDYNWRDHPLHVKDGGWNGSTLIKGSQVPAVRELLAFYTFEGQPMVFWGNDWRSPVDSMHFQLGYGTYDNQIRCWNFINSRIRADGFSTWRRGGKPRGTDVVVPPSQDVLIPTLLAEAMGHVPGVDYARLAPYVSKCLRDSDCINNNRIAMWCAQIGHESVGLKYMKEIGDAAYFAKYNNRSDLGNGPSDGPRYPGRGPIQVTGRHNYRKLSAWAFKEGFVDSPTYFEDNPTELEKLEYAFLGAVWYWTVARPDINELCDRADVETVTRRINGGTNGLQDRVNRWTRCRNMNLMPLLGEDDPLAALSDEQTRRLMLAVDKIIGGNSMPAEWTSRGMFAPASEDQVPVDDTVGMILNTDGNAWNVVMIFGALLGVDRDVQAVNDTAAGKFPKGSFLAIPENKWLRERAVEFATLLKPLCGLLPSLLQGEDVPAAEAPAKKAAPKKKPAKKAKAPE